MPTLGLMFSVQFEQIHAHLEDTTFTSCEACTILLVGHEGLWFGVSQGGYLVLYPLLGTDDISGDVIVVGPNYAEVDGLYDLFLVNSVFSFLISM